MPVEDGVVAPFEVATDSAREASDGASGSVLLSLGVVVKLSALASGGAIGPVLVPSAGASVFGLDFLRGFIRAGREKELSRLEGLWRVY